MSEVLEEKPEKVELNEKEGENVRPKRTRRGKKRRYKHQNLEDNAELDSEGFKIPSTQSTSSGSISSASRKRQRRVLIRPVDVPKAPENSTQFLMDDHDECHLYVSFETPNPYLTGTQTSGEDYSEDAAFMDIDYKYESMQDLDNSAYYIQDFEVSYSNVRYEELFRLSRPELVTMLENLEMHLMELANKLYEQDPGSALEQLQQKLLQLQETNVLLHEENVCLTSALESAVYETVDESPCETAEHPPDSNNHSMSTHDNSYDTSGSSHDSSNHEDSNESQDGSYLPDFDDQLCISYEHLHDEDNDSVLNYSLSEGSTEHLQNGTSPNSSVQSMPRELSNLAEDLCDSTTEHLEDSATFPKDTTCREQNSNESWNYLEPSNTAENSQNSSELSQIIIEHSPGTIGSSEDVIKRLHESEELSKDVHYPSPDSTNCSRDVIEHSSEPEEFCTFVHDLSPDSTNCSRDIIEHSNESEGFSTDVKLSCDSADCSQYVSERSQSSGGFLEEMDRSKSSHGPRDRGPVDESEHSPNGIQGHFSNLFGSSQNAAEHVKLDDPCQTSKSLQ